MISIIVPVYNVEPYLRKCLDSIVEQTYRDLEILVIDDGSTDGSGRICDEYEKQDQRIKVFHTVNRGLSAARNLGLYAAKGEWIGFVDSDDWIESEMYELMLRKAEETGANVVECSYCHEYANAVRVGKALDDQLQGMEALEALIEGKIKASVWNKIWKRFLFDEIEFPEGRNFEDIATVYKLIQKSVVIGLDFSLYHYIQRSTGISRSHDKQNLLDFWTAHKERYDNLSDLLSEENVVELIRYCTLAIYRVWVWWPLHEMESKTIDEMVCFTCERIPLFGYKNWKPQFRMISFLVRHKNKVSFLSARLLYKLYRLFKPLYYE